MEGIKRVQAQCLTQARLSGTRQDTDKFKFRIPLTNQVPDAPVVGMHSSLKCGTQGWGNEKYIDHHCHQKSGAKEGATAGKLITEWMTVVRILKYINIYIWKNPKASIISMTLIEHFLNVHAKKASSI